MPKVNIYPNGVPGRWSAMILDMVHTTIWTSDITTRVKVAHMQHWKILRWAFLKLGEL